MKFKFSLQTVLQLRNLEKQEAQRYLSEALEAVTIVDQRLEETERERQEVRRRLMPQVGRVAINSLLSGGRYELHIQSRIDELQKQRVVLQQEADRRRDLLKAVDIRLKQIEKLREGALERHKMEMLAIEQKQLDELAVQGHFRHIKFN
jgi:flagellar protein FliJ